MANVKIEEFCGFAFMSSRVEAGAIGSSFLSQLRVSMAAEIHLERGALVNW
jgi:hypothetical protein